MASLRLGLRLIALSVVCLGTFLVLTFTTSPLRVIEALTGAVGRTARWRVTMFGAWARTLKAILGMRVEIQGVPPRPPFILVSNHLSYVDVILIGSQLPCVFVAKAEVAGWPVIGTLCRIGGTVFIDRGRKRDLPQVMHEMDRVLAAGAGLVLFPEGTSTRGECVTRFRPSLLEPAARSGRPVHHTALSYATPDGGPPAHRTICWWGGMPFTGHFLNMLRLPRFRARLCFGEEPIAESDRKILASRLQQAVQERFQPVGGSKETR